MPLFEYQGINKAGQKITATMDAASEGDLRMILRQQGIRPIKISKGGSKKSAIDELTEYFKTGSRHVSVEAVVSFTRQLQILISSGIPLVQGLEILLEQTMDASLREIVMAVREKVSQGSYLWEALALYPQAFPKLYVSLIRAGESSGSVDQMLKRLSRYLEEADRLRRMLKSAMMYPIVVVVIGVAVIALMVIFVIPRFEEMLTSSGQALPLPTQLLIDSSHFVIKNIVPLSAATVIFVYILLRYVKSTEGRAFIDRTFFYFPLFGPIMQKGGIARFSRTLQTLLSSGVNLIDAVEICKATIDNAVLEDAVGKIRAEIETGKTLGVVLTRLEVFPKMATQMISVGESTGNLDKMLEKVADFYEEEVENLIKGMTKMMEPLVLVFLGGTVGGIMIAMYLPIFQLAGGIQ